MSEHEDSLLGAAYKYVEDQDPIQRTNFEYYYLGWQMREAFIAGANWQIGHDGLKSSSGDEYTTRVDLRNLRNLISILQANSLVKTNGSSILDILGAIPDGDELVITRPPRVRITPR